MEEIDEPREEKSCSSNDDMEREELLETPEDQRRNILPGVIRHTSCPDRFLAFYYQCDRINKVQ